MDTPQFNKNVSNSQASFSLILDSKQISTNKQISHLQMELTLVFAAATFWSVWFFS